MAASKCTDAVVFDRSVLLLKHCLSLSSTRCMQVQPYPPTSAEVIQVTPKDAVKNLHCKHPQRQAVWPRPQHSSSNCMPAACRLGPSIDVSSVSISKKQIMEPPYICITTPSASLLGLNLSLEHLVKQQCSKIERETCITSFERRFGSTLNHSAVPLLSKPSLCKALDAANITVPTPSYKIAPIPIPVRHSLIPAVTVSRHTQAPHVQWINKTDSVQKDSGAGSKHHLGSPQLLNRAMPAQLSFVLLKLREEMPAFFHGHHSFDMYARNMKFENNLGNFAWVLRGCPSYRLFLASFRLGFHCWYRSLRLDLLKITKQVEGGRIEARWRVRGEPRFGRRRLKVVLDGFSTFVINSDGQIFLHRMDKVMPAPKEKNRVQTWIAQLGVILGLTPRPSLGSHHAPPLGSHHAPP